VRYAELVYNGVCSRRSASTRRFFNVSQERVTFRRFETLEGLVECDDRNLLLALSSDLASFTMGRYNPKDAKLIISSRFRHVRPKPEPKAFVND